MRQILSHTVHASKKHPVHVGFLVLILLFTVAVLSLLSIPKDTFAVAPINTAPPSISGLPAVGQVMTVDEGVWTGLPTYDYQWRRCDSAGNNCADISGATNRTYTLQTPDGGNTVRAVVTATNVDGSDTATSNQSLEIQAMLGDINNDNVVNIFDLGILLGNWGSGSSPTSDLDGSGSIGEGDVVEILKLYQQ